MKNLKQIVIVTIIAIMMLGSFSGNAQYFPPKGNSTILIPKEYKSLKKINSQDVVFFSKFSKKVNGFVTIAYDKNFKLVSVTAPKSISKNKLTETIQQKGMADCVGDCGGTWACGAACLWDFVVDSLK